MTEPVTTPTGNGSGASRTTLIVILVAIVTVGCVIVAAIFVFRPSNSTPATTAAAATTGTPIRLEPVASATDPFAPPGQVGKGQTVTPVTTNAVTTVEGGRVGLYGGTMNKAQCDKNQLTKFLQENPDKGAAWAGVIGIDPREIPTYVAGLTPVLLRSDTAVTNHGFKNGKATTIQSVLQAGTAVLVDDKGVPVTKCYCGNPLQPPTPITPNYPTTTTSRYNESTTTTFYNTTTTNYYGYPPTYEGPQWPSWNPVSITIIQYNGTVIEIFVLVDTETGQTFYRPRGTDGSQDTTTEGSTPAPQAPSSSSGKSTASSTTTSTYEPYLPDEPCVDEYNHIVPCGSHSTPTYPTTTTTYRMPDEPCVDDHNNIVPC